MTDRRERLRAYAAKPLASSRAAIQNIRLVNTIWFFLCIAVMVALSACAPKPIGIPTPAETEKPAAMQRIAAAFEDLPGWRDGRQGEALSALLRSCPKLVGGRASEQGDWDGICKAAQTLQSGDHQAARRFFEYRFRPYLLSAGDAPDGLITGYYEASLKGSRTRHGPYQYPLYGPPKDLVNADLGLFREDLAGLHISGRVKNGRFVPHASRAEIDQGALRDHGLAFVWVDDPVDAFFLHVQGSGRIALDDGGEMRVGYAGKNGHPYRSIGKTLIEMGEMPAHEMSADRIRAWAKQNPEKGQQLLHSNPSYIFFRPRQGGAIGSQGVELTPERSIAVDRRHMMLGLPVWLTTTHPRNQTPINRLMVAQDTGSAINGVVRADYFWGVGEDAKYNAGAMKHKGRMYVLVPRN